ncbi:FtsW/RodA/SpoVE family cell cycle protein [Streptomyces litchfieldiae]|uniref:FtsW/RodA/SpoVE family cell cycle protein n=1 Tax=Streptomyces litchfieldiae TaxID=3075543 RepID=A0ABU2ML60_9ACTN|nr:FtsW/RodA/SpoVE family cell cycle protein [Streptomyces sp. DSM 44938]MDT0342118.1 FtsW/RodA/SpoVE family cell cycle protein [Streptomyces sp. DSM 44938]
MSGTSNTTVSTGGLPSRRNTELAMLVFAVLIPVFAYANVGLAKEETLPAGMLGYGLGLGLIAGVAHLVVRRYAPYADPLMLPIATLLNGLGLVLIWRLDQEPQITDPELGQQGAMAADQLIWSTLGVALFVTVLLFLKDHRILQRYTYISMVVALILLASPIFVGEEINGARIWVQIPGVGSLQPGEFAKIIIAVFFAGYLMVKRDALALASRRVMGIYLPRGRDLGPILVIWAISLLILIFETDLGTSLLFFGIFVVMLYVATERTSWIIFGLLLSASGAVFVANTNAHVGERVHNWLNPLELQNGGVTETAQSMYAFGSGGLFGSGLGQGYSRLIGGIATKSDYILATVGEELGLAGLMAVILLYALLIERGMRTALAARDPFGKLLAIGLSGIFAIQVFVVAGGVTGLIPLTGMTMPFLAQGGSSVIANWALIALLLRISDTARRPAPAPAPSPDAEQTQVVRL